MGAALSLPWPHPTQPTPYTHLHVVKGNSDFLVEVRAEERDLGIALAEVVQHDELCIHPHPHANRLGGGAANGSKPGRSSTKGQALGKSDTGPAPASTSPGSSQLRITVDATIFSVFSKTVLPPRTLPRELYRNKGKRAQKQTAAPSQKPPQPSDGKQAGLTSLKGTVFPSRADARLLSLSPRGGRGSR